MNKQGGVAAVVHDKVRAAAVRPGKGHFSAPPVVFQAFALPGKNLGQALFHNGGGGVVLGGKNVAGGPADVRAQGMQRLDEHGRLNGHVQGARDLEALERLGRTVLFDAFHKARHFAFGKLHFFAAEVGQAHVRHFVRQGQIQCFGHNFSLNPLFFICLLNLLI